MKVLLKHTYVKYTLTKEKLFKFIPVTRKRVTYHYLTREIEMSEIALKIQGTLRVAPFAFPRGYSVPSYTVDGGVTVFLKYRDTIMRKLTEKQLNRMNLVTLESFLKTGWQEAKSD